MHFDFFVLNVSSLSKHLIDVKKDMHAQRADHICLVETWISPQKHKIDDYAIAKRSFYHASNGKGKGCGIYSSITKTVESTRKVIREKYQVLSMVDLQLNIQLVLVYCSSNSPFPQLIEDLQEILVRKLQYCDWGFQF